MRTYKKPQEKKEEKLNGERKKNNFRCEFRDGADRPNVETVKSGGDKHKQFICMKWNH